MLGTGSLIGQTISHHRIIEKIGGGDIKPANLFITEREHLSHSRAAPSFV